MKILSLNCGSSSLKYRLYRWPDETELVGGEAVRIGPPTSEPAQISHRHKQETETHRIDMPDHATAFEAINDLLTDGGCEPDAIGHRMVHGGEEFTTHALVTDEVMSRLSSIEDLAPLHNPPAMRLLDSCRDLYTGIPQTVIFDTVFHATLPEPACTYALPRNLRRDLGLRKYGFHGISHQYVTQRTAKYLGISNDSFNAVSCHLGSGGASLCAVRNGQSVDNTMGFSPLQGLIMSTRCGDVDPAVVLKLLSRYQCDTQRVEDLLNRESGVLGLSGQSSDIRDVLHELDADDAHRDRLDDTLQSYMWRIRKYLGSYLTVAAPTNAIIFTDTVGEEVAEVRRAVCADLGACGIQLDHQKNEAPGSLPADIARDDSPVRVVVMPTNEELAIAGETAQLIAAHTATSVNIR